MFRCRLAWIATLGLAPLLAGHPLRADDSLRVPLECQLDQGSWQPCMLTVEQMGEHWWLQIGGQRLDFRSDGRGSVTLSAGGGSHRAVQPVWTAQHALCWDGVCTKCDLPLD